MRLLTDYLLNVLEYQNFGIGRLDSSSYALHHDLLFHFLHTKIDMECIPIEISKMKNETT